MKLPSIAIHNAAFIIVLLLITTLLGLRSFVNMPRSEDPSINLPIYNIVVVYPGTSPEDMEDLIVDPLEEAIDELDDIEEVLTEIEEGLAVIRIEGKYGIDADDQFDEVAREANRLRPGLPDGIVYFDVSQFKQEDRAVIHQFALTSSTLSYARLYDIAEHLEDKLEKIEALKAVDIEAYPEEEVRIALDFQRMANNHIALPQVLGVLAGNNANIPGGEVKAQDRNFSIKTTGGFETLEAIRNTVISANNGKSVYLRDIADVKMDYEDIRWRARYRRQPAIFLTAKLKKGENILFAAEQINAVATTFQASLPPNVQLNTAFEQSSAVKGRIQGFFFNLLQGIALVGLIIFLFLGWRPAVIIMTIIPLCIIIALAILNSTGYALQQISIAALVIALGLLVDNGIVVVENINRFLQEGYSLTEAAARGASEVGYAIISSTVTTLLAFFPLTQLGEGPGEFLRSLPLTVMFTLIISLILALTLSPILASRLLKKGQAGKPPLAIRWMNRVIERVYRPSLRFALRKGWLAVGLAVALLVFAISLFPSIGVSFFPTADKPMLLIEVDTPSGTSIDGTDRAVRFVEQVLDTMPYVKDYTANVGHGNPLVYYNRIPEEYKKNHGQLLVNFKEWNPRLFYEALNQLRHDFRHFPGAKITFSELKNGAPFKAPIEIRIIGEDPDTLKQLAFELEQLLGRTSGVINVDNPLRADKTALKVRLNQEKAGLIGLSHLDFDQAVRASLTGLRFAEAVFDDGEEYPLAVRMPFESNPSITDLNKVYLTTRPGAQVPLRQVADIGFESTIAEILHFNLDRHTTVTADVIDADQTVTLTQEIMDELAAYSLPEGYTFYAAGEYENQQSAFGNLGVILLLAQVAIFAVLILQFRSILQPLIVFSAIPLAITGSFIALYLTGWPFSFFAFVGFISLVGIVVNNSIIMVDYINQLRKEGSLSLEEAIIQGSERRFTPIVLTTITTILGLLPLTASGTTLWSPLGWAIIGGMVSSTALVLLIVPTLYKWFSREPSQEERFGV